MHQPRVLQKPETRIAQHQRHPGGNRKNSSAMQTVAHMIALTNLLFKQLFFRCKNKRVFHLQCIAGRIVKRDDQRPENTILVLELINHTLARRKRLKPPLLVINQREEGSQRNQNNRE